MTSRRDPYPFQMEAITRAYDRNILLTDECGCGKKVTCIDIAHDTYIGYNKPVLVVTVKRDTLQWQREIHLQLGTAIPVVIGTVDPITLPDPTKFWLILHYEALVRHQKALARIQWGAVILDEGHYIKNWEAQRSRAAKKLKAVRKVVSTGTPIDKSPADLWSLLDFLYPELYHGKKRVFEERHVRAYTDTLGRERILPGAKEPAALAAELAQFTFSRTKEQVAPFLPPNIIKHVSIELTGAQRRLYDRLAGSTDLLFDGPELQDQLFIPNRLALLIKLQQCTTDPRLLGATTEEAKLEWVHAWRQGNPTEPTIIFTLFRETAHRLAKELDAHLIAGGFRLPTEWTKPTLVATIDAAAEALDLGWVRTGIFVDVSWKSAKMRQAIARIHRINNTQPCETIFLSAANTVDEVMLEAVEQKWGAYDVIRGYVDRFGRTARKPG